MSQRSCDQTLALMKKMHLTGNLIPKDFYRAKKLVSKLSLSVTKIDCCLDGCMLFYINEVMQLKECYLFYITINHIFMYKVLVGVNTRRFLLRECYLPLIICLHELCSTYEVAS